MVTRDQAYELRNLVRRALAQREVDAVTAACWIAVTCGQSGAGATMISVNLAAALAQQGLRVVLVDANVRDPQVAHQCGITCDLGLVDLLSAQRNVHEVLQRGPAGVQVVAGKTGRDTSTCCSEAAVQRAIEQLRLLGPHADYIVVDLGPGPSELVRGFWSAVDLALMITTADAVCIMDTYASIKGLCGAAGRQPAIYSIVNRATGDVVAADVHRRIGQSCRRFLSVDIHVGGQIPLDDRLARAPRNAFPAIVQSPTCPAARAIDRLAVQLTARSAGPQHGNTPPPVPSYAIRS